MKLSCTQKNLERGLQIVGRAISSKTSLPILNNILFEVDKDKFKLSATDLEIGIKTKIGAKIFKKGKITVPAKVVLDFVAGNHDKNINLSLKEKKVLLKSKRYKAQINGISASEFPLIPKIEKKKTTILPLKKFYQALLKSIFAVSLDETRPVLAGLYFNLSGGILSLVATDSYRLAEKRIKINQDEEFSFIVPLKTCQEIQRIIPYSSLDGEIKICLSENQVSFQIDSTEITSRLIEGEFPDYQQIIPKNYQTRVKLEREEFLDIVKVISYFAKETANNVKIKTDPSGLVSVYSASSQIGDSQAKMEALVEGKGGEISFNAKFLTDVLSALDDEEIFFEMSGKYNPGVIRSSKDKNYVYIIMPLKTDEE